MTTKRIVVLANSVKKQGRCVAGKEVSWTDGEWRVGAWIRPVTTQEGGEVSLSFMMRVLGREPHLLEILEIPFEGPVPLPDQPENWLLSQSGSWRSLGSIGFENVSRLLDNPESLWGTKSRQVEAGVPQRMPQPSSLYLIQPELVEPLRIWTDQAFDDQSRGYDRHRRRVAVHYQGVIYELDITDPELQRRYYPNMPAKHEPVLTISLRDAQHTAICVSLTPEFHGRHYKLAAAFIEPPEVTNP